MDIIRNRKFTSSPIYQLVAKDNRCKPPKPKPLDDNSYIEEKLDEILAGRGLNEEMKSKYTIWGSFCEEYFFRNYLSVSDYKLDSKKTILYDGEIELLRDWYCGSPDIESEEEDRVGDIKCPFTIKSYLTALKCETIEDLRKNHKDGEKYYWQLVSNSILTRRTHCELIFFIPRGYALPSEEESEIERIIREIKESENPDLYNFRFQNDEFFPYLLNPNTPNIKSFKFTPPIEDKIYLLDRLVEAVKILKTKI